LTENWSTRLQYSESQNKQSTETNGSFNPSYGSFDSRMKSWQWDHHWAWSDRHILTGGLTSSRLQLDATHTGFVYVGPNPYDYAEIPVVLKPTISTQRIYAGLGSQWAAWNTQITLSRDELGGGVGSNNFLLGAGYALGSGYKLTATRSSAMLAPTVGQRYDASFGGNPSLRPERSFSDEAGLQFQGQKLKWRLVAFQARYTNLISSGSQLVSDPYWREQGVYQFENIGESRNKGYELGGSWVYGPWQMGLGMTWQTPENIHSDIKPINKAQRFGQWRLGYQVSPNTRLSWVSIGTSQRYTLAPGDSSSAPSVTSGYSLHHLSAEQKLSPQLSAKFSLLNAGDKSQSPVAGYAPQPRTWLLGLSYQSR
jgi:outer membrane cobalamin receptor